MDPFIRFIRLSAFLLLAALFSACAVNSEPPAITRETASATVPVQPTAPPTPSATPILALQPSTTPTSAPTQSPTPTRQSPTPAPRGALTGEQEQRLYQTSLTFLAEDEQSATEVVRRIDYLQSDAEDPSLACGPIAAGILRDAGLLPPDSDLHGFWLLDPRTRTSQIVLETHFPKERYAWYQFETSTTEFDFNAFPLMPGDFLYLYAGINGTFEHIITVTRVDEAGRAYTVSNLATEDGFVIRELMLYDPSRPGVGQFYDWMNRDLNGWLGMTGDGGFDLWRPLPPAQDYEIP